MFFEKQCFSTDKLCLSINRVYKIEKHCFSTDKLCFSKNNVFRKTVFFDKQCLSINRVYRLRYSTWSTPLNNPPIEIHANSSMFALIFWPHVTIFCIFWLYECLKWILELNSKSLFWCQSRQIFEVRAIEQRHHEFQLIHMPPHQFWPRYHSDGLSPVHVRFEFFSKQICNVEALICHF